MKDFLINKRDMSILIQNHCQKEETRDYKNEPRVVFFNVTVHINHLLIRKITVKLMT